MSTRRWAWFAITLAIVFLALSGCDGLAPGGATVPTPTPNPPIVLTRPFVAVTAVMHIVITPPPPNYTPPGGSSMIVNEQGTVMAVIPPPDPTSTPAPAWAAASSIFPTPAPTPTPA